MANGPPAASFDPKTIVGRSVAPPAEELVPLKFNYRYGNINAGEVAGFPESIADELLSTKAPGMPGKMVAEKFKGSRE